MLLPPFVRFYSAALYGFLIRAADYRFRYISFRDGYPKAEADTAAAAVIDVVVEEVATGSDDPRTVRVARVRRAGPIVAVDVA